jgi:hypothetical protein
VECREQERQRLLDLEAQPNLFPNAPMKRRDTAAKELDQRLVQRTFKDPNTKRSRKFWGRLHFQGEEARPYYFKVVYDDGEVLEATVTGVKRYLMPAGTQLPAGVSIPPLPVAALGLQGLPRAAPQCIMSSRHAQGAAIPAATVPPADLQLLERTVQLSLAQAICDPITCSRQWLQLFARSRVPLSTAAVRHGASVVIMAPAAQYERQAVHAGLRQRPALLLCYISALAFPDCLNPLFTALKRQQRALAVRGSQGWWLMMCQPGMALQQWLR